MKKPGASEEIYMNDESANTIVETHEEHNHTGLFALLIIGLVLSLAGNAFLLTRTSAMRDQMAQLTDGTQSQISHLSDATKALLEQRMDALNQEMNSQVKGAEDSAAKALRQARLQSQKQGDEIAAKLEDQQKQVAENLDQLRDASDSKISAVSSDVDNVKTDVTGVKTEVATTKDGLEKTSADLKRAMGDMGVMSGLIATNSKDLQTLRELGERNYVEFTLNKTQATKKFGDMVVTYKKADPKHNRYTVAIQADDKLLEKRDRSTNEPVQVYVHDSRQPYEVVVNKVNKDEIVGYVSTPKMSLARQ
jgi:chromosome segregation ATPase